MTGQPGPESGGRQLALPFAHEAHFGDDFLPGAANAAARAWVARGAWPGGRLALWGGAGSGKTHLLHLWARGAGAAVVDGAGVRGGFEGLGGGLGGVAVDDADLAGEGALLHLLNAAQEAGRPVLLAARGAPARWGTGLADLRSRLRAVVAVELGAPEDALLRALFARLLAERQLVVGEGVREWMLARLPRTGAALREAAAGLDRASLGERGGVTRALAARVLPGVEEAEEGEAGPVLL
ncbi:MAG: chromosomal replication initiator DnaA [Janthinobacterium lividum]